MPVAPSKNFLVSKAGPLPVWGWGAIGLGAAYGYSRYKANKAAKNAPADQNQPQQFTYGAGQPVSGQPTYLIENNIPGFGSVPSGPSTPVVTPPNGGPTPPVVTPPVTTPTPPVVTPPTPPVHVPHITGSTTHRVQPGDSYSRIAAQYHLPGGWQELYAYNTNPNYNAAYATFQRQGPNLLYSNQTIHVPVYS